MKILIVDDKFYAVDDLHATLMKIHPKAVCFLAYSADEALKLMEENADIDIAFCDVDMPGKSGIVLAERLIAMKPTMNIIFVTGYKEYAFAAHELYASGFLVKPASREAIENALAHLRYPVGEDAPQAVVKEKAEKKRVRIECYGDFAVFIDDIPVRFDRRKSLELLAYLVDRKGAPVTNGQLMAVLWEDGVDSEGRRGYLRHLIADVRSAFADAGIDNILIKDRDSIALNRKIVSCDYYEDEDVDLTEREYMAQFSWAEYSKGFCGKNE